MTGQNVGVSNPEADARWRHWQARGDAADRRRATRMGRLAVVTMFGLAIWLLVQLI